MRHADLLTLEPSYRLARPEHAAGPTELLADPRVSDPIYDLPRPITPGNISDWIAGAQRKRVGGEGLLVVMLDDGGEVCGHSCFTVWRERSAAEIAGGYRADRQSQGESKRRAARSFDWMFDAFGVMLIAATAAQRERRPQMCFVPADQ